MSANTTPQFGYPKLVTKDNWDDWYHCMLVQAQGLGLKEVVDLKYSAAFSRFHLLKAPKKVGWHYADSTTSNAFHWGLTGEEQVRVSHVETRGGLRRTRWKQDADVEFRVYCESGSTKEREMLLGLKEMDRLVSEPYEKQRESVMKLKNFFYETVDARILQRADMLGDLRAVVEEIDRFVNRV
ncbi:hypothetical protein QBC35DRAFT_479122 [Podospora australis]|uniref:Uncharacterized protein n=1 Tax=Podospora australis TaxID=1536484 RepID=A0AAN7AE04_9PEZI|nr:hypothetical protein QBC35DRAFT_479122 [Podospora australis]